MNYYKDDEMMIREPKEKDVTSLFSWWIDREGNEFDPRPIPETCQSLMKECSRYCRRISQEVLNPNISERKYTYFMITDLEDRPLGFVNFFSIDAVKKQGEMGVEIGDKRYWRKGIAAKAVKAATNYIFAHMDIRRIYIETGENNYKALGLFKKLGFVPCGEYMEEDGFRFIVMELLKE